MTLAIIVFAVGVMLVLVEVFIPSFGLLTLGALCCFGLSVYMAHASAGSAAAWTMGVIAPVLTAVILYLGFKFIPRTSFGRGLVLFTPSDEGTAEEPSSTQTSAVTAQGGTSENE
ncbi:MAG: hypothetical protein ACODAJ_15585, partial [Planctomycetota bacterium]